MCWSLSLFVFFMALTGSLVVWRLRHASSAGSRRSLAEQSLQVLNTRVHHQSKHIAEGCESTLLLMRHCEKDGRYEYDKDGISHCSYVGMERSYFLPTLFGSRWPRPSRLFALTPDRGSHLNFREYETLHPLSIQLGVPVEIADQDDLAARYFALLRSGSMCGRLTVVSWKHSLMGEMAQLLGCDANDGCPRGYPVDNFDQVWQLKYVFHPTAPDKDATEEDFIHNDTNTLKHHKRPHMSGWSVFATVSQQGFDPLSFSYQSGDYPEGGSPTGGKWREEL